MSSNGADDWNEVHEEKSHKEAASDATTNEQRQVTRYVMPGNLYHAKTLNVGLWDPYKVCETLLKHQHINSTD